MYFIYWGSAFSCLDRFIFFLKNQNVKIFLHAHLKIVHFNHVKLHQNQYGDLGGIALTRSICNL